VKATADAKAKAIAAAKAAKAASDANAKAAAVAKAKAAAAAKASSIVDAKAKAAASAKAEAAILSRADTLKQLSEIYRRLNKHGKAITTLSKSMATHADVSALRKQIIAFMKKKSGPKKSISSQPSAAPVSTGTARRAADQAVTRAGRAQAALVASAAEAKLSRQALQSASAANMGIAIVSALKARVARAEAAVVSRRADARRAKDAAKALVAQAKIATNGDYCEIGYVAFFDLY
jgi:hypothetical protein